MAGLVAAFRAPVPLRLFGARAGPTAVGSRLEQAASRVPRVKSAWRPASGSLTPASRCGP